jgi:microcystin-dependent protein
VLFSLLGTTYGGNGTTTFALPDLRGRVPVHYGSGPLLTPMALGEKSGDETVTLLSSNLPAHTHTATLQQPCTTQPATHTDPAGHAFAVPTNGNLAYATAGGSSAMAGVITTGSSGGSQPHPNIQPYLTINFIIALQGIFPSRT